MIICGCLLALRKFLSRFAPTLIGEGSSRRYGGTGNYHGPGPDAGSYELKSSRKSKFSRQAYSISRLSDEPELGPGKGVVVKSDWQVWHGDDNSEKATVGPM